MHKSLHALCAASLSLVVLGASAQSTRAGLWEVNSKMGGNPELEAAMAQMEKQMAAMPPEQRKMMQEMMAKQGVSYGAGAGGSMLVKVCLTPEMVARQQLPTQTEGSCTTTVTSRSANTMKMSFVCTDPASNGEGTYTFSSDTAYTMKMAIRSMQDGKPHNMTIDAQGKWLSKDCGNIKPIQVPTK